MLCRARTVEHVIVPRDFFLPRLPSKLEAGIDHEESAADVSLETVTLRTGLESVWDTILLYVANNSIGAFLRSVRHTSHRYVHGIVWHRQCLMLLAYSASYERTVSWRCHDLSLITIAKYICRTTMSRLPHS